MKRAALLTLVTLVTAACLGSDFADSIEGSWVLASGSANGEPILVLESHPITMTLDGSNIDGTAACNGYGGTYRVASNGNFQIVDGLSITEMACSPPEVMDSEAQFMEAMINVDHVALDGTTLTLSGEGYELAFGPDDDPPPPAATDPADDPDEPVSNVELFGEETFGAWVLVSGTADGQPIPMVETHPITLEISEQGFGGTSACNGYGHSLPLPDDGTFPPIVSTMMACMPDEVMDSEAAYLAALQRYQSSSIVDGQLVIVGDGVELVYDPA
jgi:heat shock protein HslJ